MKYEMTSETTVMYGKILYRIKAIKDFGVVKTGDIGGWIESEINLSQDGDCWIFDNAMVYGDARVFGDAEIFSSNHVMTIGAIGSRGDFTTFYRGKDKQIMVKCGCFNDTVDRTFKRQGEPTADFINCKAFGKNADFFEKYG